jgi:hypothetical protein
MTASEDAKEVHLFPEEISNCYCRGTIE